MLRAATSNRALVNYHFIGEWISHAICERSQSAALGDVLIPDAAVPPAQRRSLSSCHRVTHQEWLVEL
jgi:hypothetical protein